MNTSSHIDTGYQARLAGTLRSLSLEATPHDPQPPRPGIRRLILCLLIAITAMGFILARTDMSRHMQTLLAAMPGGAASASRSAPDMEKSTTSHPVPVMREITGSGFVVTPRRTTVFARYEGRITHIAVETGDRVEAGQILVVLNDATARFALEQAQAAEVSAQLVLDEKNIDLAQASVSLRRIEALATGDAVSRQILDEARTARERSTNAVSQARQNLSRAALTVRIAMEAVAELTVRAPFAGTVTRLGARIGDTVLARADSVRENQSLLTITDTTRLEIEADVAETNMASLKPRLRGEAVLDGFPETPFAVEVMRIAPVASAEKGTITLRLSLGNPPDGIRPNMAARVRILFDNAGDMTQ